MFSRYPTGFPPISSFPPNPMNDPWVRLQSSRGLPPTPSSVYGPTGGWPIKPDPVETERAEQQQREREREREREKERERGRERERVKREEKRKQMIQQQQLQHQQQQQHLQHQHQQQQHQQHQQHQQQVNKMRERSPLKDPNLMPKEEDLNNMMLGRVPPPSHYLPPPPRHPQRALPAHFSPWDQYRYVQLYLNFLLTEFRIYVYLFYSYFNYSTK